MKQQSWLISERRFCILHPFGQHLGVGQDLVLLEARQALLAGLELGLVALAVVQHEEAVLLVADDDRCGHGDVLGHELPEPLRRSPG